MPKITHKDIDDSLKEYYNNQDSYKDLRLGQYLMNVLVPTESNSDIFYEEEEQIALNKFINEYVE